MVEVAAIVQIAAWVGLVIGTSGPDHRIKGVPAAVVLVSLLISGLALAGNAL